MLELMVKTIDDHPVTGVYELVSKLLALKGKHNGRETMLVECYVDGNIANTFSNSTSYPEYHSGYRDGQSDMIEDNYRQMVEVKE